MAEKKQVRVGMSIGGSPNHPAHTLDMRQETSTQEEKDEAKRKIEGAGRSDMKSQPI